ncbi:ATP-binding cassette sub- A member 2 [Sarracenia purpurea var. burkii]
MELQRGFPLLIQQCKALFMKNFIVSCRNRRFTIAQLLSPFIFMAMLFFCGRSGGNEGGDPVYDPPALVSHPIPPCEDKFFITRPCFDLAWSGNGSATIASIVARIMENNPGRIIPPSKVKSFRTKKEVDEWLFNDPMRCPGVLHFEEINDSVISYGVQTNSTQIQLRGQYEDPTFKFQIPLQIAAEREIARFLIGDPNFSWSVGIKEFAHPVVGMSAALAKQIAEGRTKFLAPVLFLAITMFSFVYQISSLVTEKELKLRQTMSMMGLYDTAYWLSWLTWETTFALFSSLVTVLCGMMFQIHLFLRNSFAILFLVFFLFNLSMSISTFLMSLGGWSIFAVKYQIMWALFPPNLLSIAASILDTAATGIRGSGGISWSKLSECYGPHDDCAITISRILIGFVATFFMWCIVAIYLDNIIPNPSGLRKSIFYFLNPGYWTGKGGNMAEDDGIFSCIRSIPRVEHKTPDDDDVFQEENRVKQQVRDSVVDPNIAVQICGLVKTYPGKTQIGCCKCRRRPHHHAVKGLWVNIPKDQLFCLLGPNGAGKTTTISCLTGISPVTSGDALIYGHSVRSSIGMSNIRKIIGVCPQFDILWDALSGEEHLYLFASIKGIPAASIKSVAQKLLADVRLKDAAKRRAGGYSGGMKRRLSVAIALIGDPKLVILDEPTTGMDPITRRHVWDIIENAKKGRAIILTTHSMEEADILGDRIGIVAKGTLRCIGTSIRLKSKFGSGLITNVSFSETTTDAAKSCHEALKNFFKQNLGVVPKEETKYFQSYVIPNNKESLLTNFFAELQAREREFGIADIQLGLTTLEEVFLNVAKKAALENAAVENNLVTLTLTSGTSLLIPMGVEFIGIPGTESPENPRGLMVEVYWGQDSDGNLCISGHSDEAPIPDTVGYSLPTNPPSELGQIGPLHGIVLNF